MCDFRDIEAGAKVERSKFIGCTKPHKHTEIAAHVHISLLMYTSYTGTPYTAPHPIPYIVLPRRPIPPTRPSYTEKQKEKIKKRYHPA